MRYYPDADVDFFVELTDGWDRYIRCPTKRWKYRALAAPSTMNYWRDLEGAKKKEILNADLYFENWIPSRINRGSCLPLLYAVGNRFIKLSKTFPAGFKCSYLPMNLIEAREMRAIIKEEEKQNKKGKGKKKGKKGKK